MLTHRQKQAKSGHPPVAMVFLEEVPFCWRTAALLEARSEDQVEEMASDSHLKDQDKGSERPDWSPLFEDPSESSESLEVRTTLESARRADLHPRLERPEQQTFSWRSRRSSSWVEV